MDVTDTARNQAATSNAKQQAAGGNKVAIETFEKREQRRSQNDADNPSRADGVFETQLRS